MAVTVLTNAYVSLNSVDVSAKCRSISFPRAIAELDATTFGSDTTVNEPGLKSFSVDVEFLSDYTDDDFDEDMHALWDARTKFAVAWRPSATAVGAANPQYGFTGFISDWSDGGEVGTLAGGSITLSNSSTLTRSVT